MVFNQKGPQRAGPLLKGERVMRLDGEKVLAQCREGCHQRIMADERGHLVVKVQRDSEAQPETVHQYPIERVMAAQIFFKDPAGHAFAVYPGHRYWSALSRALWECMMGIDPTSALAEIFNDPPPARTRLNAEEMLQRHLEREGQEAGSIHPDGCYHCGGAHPTGCCPNLEAS